MHRACFLRPARGLEGLVRCYVQRLGRVSGATVIHPVQARAVPILEFSFGDKIVATDLNGKNAKTTHNSDLIGMQTHHRLQLHIRGTVDCFVILFQPAGLNRLFSLPMDEFTNRAFDAESVLGPVIARLHQRLGDCASLDERVSVVDQFLLRRARASGALDGVTAAANQIIRRGGCESIPALAGSAGLSMRHFERRFAQQVGTGPKLFARSARLEAVMDRMARRPTRSWADVAHRFGYFDQMHMIHDFNELAGSSPGKALETFKLFFRDELVALYAEQDPTNALCDTRLII